MSNGKPEVSIAVDTMNRMSKERRSFGTLGVKDCLVQESERVAIHYGAVTAKGVIAGLRLL